MKILLTVVLALLVSTVAFSQEKKADSIPPIVVPASVMKEIMEFEKQMQQIQQHVKTVIKTIAQVHVEDYNEEDYTIDFVPGEVSMLIVKRKPKLISITK